MDTRSAFADWKLVYSKTKVLVQKLKNHWLSVGTHFPQSKQKWESYPINPIYILINICRCMYYLQISLSWPYLLSLHGHLRKKSMSNNWLDSIMAKYPLSSVCLFSMIIFFLSIICFLLTLWVPGRGGGDDTAPTTFFLL